MSRHTVVLRDLATGAARSGLIVSLKKYNAVSQQFEDFQTAVEVSGDPGVYSFNDVPYARYKLFINDVVETSFDNAASDGRWFGGPILEFIDNIDLNSHKIVNVADPVNPKDATNKQWVDNNKIDKAGDDMTGPLNMHQNFIHDLKDPVQDNDSATKVYVDAKVNTKVNKAGDDMTGPLNMHQNFIHDLKDPVQDNDSATKIYVDNRSFHFGTNTIVVDSSLPLDTTGKFYRKIQDAINYCHSFIPAPSFSNRFNILITENINDTGYNEDLTLQPYINLIGLGCAKITGILTGGSFNSELNNLIFLPPIAGNFSINNIKAKNCYFKILNDDTGYILSFQSCLLNNCGLINKGTQEFSPKIVSGGGNIFINCVSNTQCILQNNDKGSISSLEDVTIDFS